MSQHMSATLVELEHLMHRVNQSQRAIAGVRDQPDTLDWQRYEDTPHNWRGESESSIQGLREALCILQSQLDSAELHINYLRERARNQLRVVSFAYPQVPEMIEK